MMKSLEEGVTTIGETNLMESFGSDQRFFFILNNDGWELLMVANHYELFNRWSTIGRQGTENGKDLRFKDLRGFVEDCQVEMHELEQIQMRTDGCHGTHNDVISGKHRNDFIAVSFSFHQTVHQTVMETRIARQFPTHAKI